MMFNDFESIYQRLGQLYFTGKIAREMSRKYYESLEKAITSKNKSVYHRVQETMIRAQILWQEIQ
ncbi:MAG: hypothetical protein KAH09_00375 [Desulfobacula sp.]|nr:hypothetical protein [Desulfobacula sp.]